MVFPDAHELFRYRGTSAMDEIKTPSTRSDDHGDDQHDRENEQGLTPRSDAELKKLFSKEFMALCERAGRFLPRPKDSSQSQEDIIQDTLMNMFVHLRHGNNARNLEAFFKKAAKNTALNAVERAAVRRRGAGAVYDVEQDRHQESLPDAKIIAYEFQEAITKFIERLPDQEREVVRRRLQGEELADIASALKITESAALRAWQRALPKLQQYVKSLGEVGLMLLAVFASVVVRSRDAAASSPPSSNPGASRNIIIKILALVALMGGTVALVARTSEREEPHARARAFSRHRDDATPTNPFPASTGTTRSREYAPARATVMNTDAAPSVTPEAGTAPSARQSLPMPNVALPRGVRMEQLFDRPAVLVYAGITGVGINDPPWLSLQSAQSGDGPLVVRSVTHNPYNSMGDCTWARRGPFIMIECPMPAGPARPVNTATRELLIGWVNGDQFVGNAWRGTNGGLMMGDAWSLRGMDSRQNCDQVYWWGGLPVREVIHYVCEVARGMTTCTLPLGTVSYTPDPTVRPVRIWADFSLDEGWNPTIHINSRHGGAWSIAADGRTAFSGLIDPGVVWDDHLIAQAPQGIILGLRTRSTTATIPGSRPMESRCE